LLQARQQKKYLELVDKKFGDLVLQGYKCSMGDTGVEMLRKVLS